MSQELCDFDENVKSGPKPCKKKAFHHRASAFLFTHNASIAILVVASHPTMYKRRTSLLLNPPSTIPQFPFTHKFPTAALAVVAYRHANKEPRYCSLPSAILQSTLTLQRSSLLTKSHCTTQTCPYTAALDYLLRPTFLCFPQHKLGPDRCFPGIVLIRWCPLCTKSPVASHFLTFYLSKCSCVCLCYMPSKIVNSCSSV
jgi:hypothetical protein